MIFEISFVLIGGANLGLEKSWLMIERLIKRYPDATWKRVVNWKNKKGKYIVEIN